jgi:negative regulator of replication initiation
MGDIKSAREIAREKVEKLGEASDEERLRWKYVPEGEKLASRYLKQNLNLVAELGNFDQSVTRYIKEGAADILLRNINLPKNDLARKNNKKTMEGLKTLKKDKIGVENVYSKMRNIFNHYTEQGEQQRKQAYTQLKAEFEAKVQQAVQQQLGSMVGIRINVERQPQFQEEWRRLLTQLDSQYISLLNEYKQELAEIA